MTDVTSLIPIAASTVSSFSIGFAKLSIHGEQENAEPAGSGALVTVGSIRGILTAAHVLEELPDDGEVGLIRFTTGPTLQKQTIDMSIAQKLIICATGDSADGPDIGFLRLAPNQAATLNATNVFFKLAKRQEAVLENRHPSCEYFEGVSGIIAEWTIDNLRGEGGFRRLKGFRGLFGVGLVDGTRECNGYDLVSFETNRNESENAPSDYRGWSGGALWRVYVTKDNDGQPSVSDKRIFGVAFHQSDLVEGKRTITCHGPKSVYQNLLREVALRWPSA